MTGMPEEQAKVLATLDRDWIARPHPSRIRGVWCVWSNQSDHVVEFDDVDRSVEHCNGITRYRAFVAERNASRKG
jgi:hypothetical protein